MKHLSLVLLLVLSGCWQETRESEQVQKEDIAVSGTIDVPNVGTVPFSLEGSRDLTSTTKEEARSQIDGKAIGNQIAAAIKPMIQTAANASGLGGLGDASTWLLGLLGLGTGGSAISTTYLAKLKRKQLREQHRHPDEKN